LGITRGLNEGEEDYDSDEESPYGDDSDFSDKIGIERKLIRPQLKPPDTKLHNKERKEDNLLHIFKFQNSAAAEAG
jgi:hypothetical protein